MPRKRLKKEDVHISSMKVGELKEELLSRGLDTTGKKADLLTRLEGAIQGTPSLKKSRVRKPRSSLSASAKATPSSRSGSSMDYSKLRVADLKKELLSKGLSTSGKKQDLIYRLQTASGDMLNEEKCEETMEGGDIRKAKKTLAINMEGRNMVKGKRKADCSDRYWEVYEDWDCMLYKTGDSMVHDKFYIIQILQHGQERGLWMRTGPIGSNGQSFWGPFGPYDNLSIIRDTFKAKFLDKTGNLWEDRGNFKPVPGKYTLMEVEDESEEEVDDQTSSELAAMTETSTGPPLSTRPCTLDEPTKMLMKLLFNFDVLIYALKCTLINTKKKPLGKVSKALIKEGNKALEPIEDVLYKIESRAVLEELTFKFYSIIPHDFGRKNPPIIEHEDTLQMKFNMLMALGDIIEMAHSMQNIKDKRIFGVAEIPHELDAFYRSLNCDLTLVDPSSHEHHVISKYTISTTACLDPHVLEVWRVDQHNVNDRFKENDSIMNRRLLWCRCSMLPVLVAILKYGQRIMSHTGGPLGKGIHHSSIHHRLIHCAACPPDCLVGMMILSEVALGKEHHVIHRDRTITAPPAGFDCVIGKGRCEPDPKDDMVLKMGGNDVVVPQGTHIITEFRNSFFAENEYVVYKESQTRIRYLVKVQYGPQ